MKKIAFGLMATAIAGVFASQAMAAPNFVAGKDYTVLTTPQPTDNKAKIEVREFFWYGCPHCYALEPHMQTWLKKLPKDVHFVRTPAPLNPTWELGAKAYYASEALGVRQNTHIPLFDAHHEASRGVLDEQALTKFFTRYKVSESQFKSAFNSFAVAQRIAKAKRLMQNYQLSGVPAVVVNGKYMVQGEDAKVTQVIDFLVEKERKAKK
ncbi:MAG: thiol:disulfide interchange protein DsbA/DsbL [Acinetobacter sp.]|nr:thiol:disulfide interchange protein DsbA/DsbL [Acinetobacter sp.]